ncbi:MAG: ABC transporter permease [Nitrospira sp.]|nr:ABC transporter permease [Nitrospira sp.]
MRILVYSIKMAYKNICLEKWINLLTVLSISIGLSIFCVFMMLSLNFDSAIQHWSKSFGIVVYLDRDITQKSEEALKNVFLEDPDILDVNYVSKEEAMKEVRMVLGENALILDNMKNNPLPASFEIKLKSALLKPKIVSNKAAEIKILSGVDEVQYGEKWLSSLNTISKAMRNGAGILGGAMLIAISFMTYSTIKMFFNRRQDDIEILKLLGAPRSFIRLPFLIEGLFIGTMGGLISSVGLFGVYTFTAIKIVEFMPSIKLFMASLPFMIYIMVPVAGAFMSVIGSFIAVGRLRYLPEGS